MFLSPLNRNLCTGNERTEQVRARSRNNFHTITGLERDEWFYNDWEITLEQTQISQTQILWGWVDVGSSRR